MKDNLKIAVITDIHGNYLALEKCLKDAKERKVNRFIFLGDYTGEFAYPQKTMEMLYELRDEYDCSFLRGNKEDYYLNRKRDIDCDWKDGNHGVGAIKYNYENLTQKDLEFFESLPISMTYTYGNLPPIMFCHGSPEHNNDGMREGEESTSEICKRCKEPLMFRGHTHTGRELTMHGTRVITVGSIGLPCFGTVHSAPYVILEPENNDWKITLIELEFDGTSLIKDIYDSGLYEQAPYWCRITFHFLKYGNIAHGRVLKEAMRLCNYEYPYYNIPDQYWDKAMESFGIE